jgi:Lon-like ATP-dependent protease
LKRESKIIKKAIMMTESKEAVSKDKHLEDDLLAGIELKTTEEIEVPKLLVDQVIGQEHGVEVIKKAANQRRHVMLIGTPGTGKSMLASSMAELLPKEELQDTLAYPNVEDKNNPKIRVVPRGKGKEIVDAQRQEVRKRIQMRNAFFMFTFFLIMAMGLIYAVQTGRFEYVFWSIIAAAVVLLVFRWVMPKEEAMMPKLLVTNAGRETAPFVDATGAHSGALLGDVRHDPYQSGGLETPAHDRVEAGAIHKAHKGILFIDEINTLRIEAQQNLLTALQEKEYSITGQSERSAGAMVKTDPVPCDFIMVAAGNLDAIAGMHPALRSRIKGYGYELYMKDSMDDTPENRKKLVRFVSQEVRKDKKIPHFDRSGVEEIVREAMRRSGRKGHLTLILRDLGGLVRVAGDIAHAEGAKYTTGEHVVNAKMMARSVEQQLADEYLEHRKDYKLFKTEGYEVGRVNGLAVVGDSGVMLPIIAEVTPAQSREEGRVIATGRLQEIAQEAVQNVSAVFKKFTGKDISRKDIHIQFVGTYEGVEGDSASISVATAVISSLENIPVNQRVAMTGSLSVRGDVLPVGGITPKIEAAVQAGIKEVLIPQSNMNDVLIEEKYKDKVKITPVVTIEDVLEHALEGKMKTKFIEKIKSFTMMGNIIPESVVDKRIAQ